MSKLESQAPALNSSVNLYVARCDEFNESQAALCKPLLSADERERNARYRFAKDRHRDVLARSLLRTVLGEYLQLDPKSLAFEKGEHGKPELINDQENTAINDLQFNLSHAGEWVVLAVAKQRVGIDIEFTPRQNDVMAIATRYFFGDEIGELHRFPEAEQRQRFFDYWTLKEAYMKARGEGISLGLDNFGFSVVDNPNISIQINEGLNDNPKQWQFYCVTPDPDYRLSLAINTVDRPKINCQQRVPLHSAKDLDWTDTLFR